MQTFKECIKKSYLHPERYPCGHKDMFETIHISIVTALDGFENFDGIDFCDVGAGGIQIRGHHKRVKGYCFGEQVTIKYDFSNSIEAVDEFITMWKAHDNDEALHDYLEFIAFGEKFGWD